MAPRALRPTSLRGRGDERYTFAVTPRLVEERDPDSGNPLLGANDQPALTPDRHLALPSTSPKLLAKAGQRRKR
jgi:hypothetical protein